MDRNEQITSKDVFPKRSADWRNRKTQDSFDVCNREQKTIFRISGACDVINSNCLIYLLNRLSFLSVHNVGRFYTEENTIFALLLGCSMILRRGIFKLDWPLEKTLEETLSL